MKWSLTLGWSSQLLFCSWMQMPWSGRHCSLPSQSSHQLAATKVPSGQLSQHTCITLRHSNSRSKHIEMGRWCGTAFNEIIVHHYYTKSDHSLKLRYNCPDSWLYFSKMRPSRPSLRQNLRLEDTSFVHFYYFTQEVHVQRDDWHFQWDPPSGKNCV